MNHEILTVTAASPRLFQAAELAEKLWPHHAKEELYEEFASILEKKPAAFFVLNLDGKPAGIAQCELRTDYVEGTASSPVGYLEGIFLLPEFRGQGLSALLLKACETWAKEKGCREFASDCELENETSIAFHKRSGFKEAGRIVCFVKPLNP